MTRWSVFEGEGMIAVIPQAPLLIRLRQMMPDTHYSQPALRPLKRFMDLNFFVGPGAIFAALYLPQGGGFLVMLGIASLAVASLYWFASHWLCERYLRYRGYEPKSPVEAEDFETAMEKAGA